MRAAGAPLIAANAIGSRTHEVGACDLYKEERDVLEEELKKIDEGDMEEFGTLR